jgi:hypothetical protein
MSCVPTQLGLVGLCGAFTDGQGHVVLPIAIGDSRTYLVPQGAVALQLGINDDKFGDNVGAFNVQVTTSDGQSWTGSIDAKTMPWSSPLNPSYPYGINDGLPPVVVPLTIGQGKAVTVKWLSGLVNYIGASPTYDGNGTPAPTGSTPGSTGKGFPSRYMQDCTGPTPTYWPYLVIPSGAGQTVNELDGHSSVGQMDIQAIDPVGYLRSLAARTDVAGGRARFCMGFPGMALGEFTTMHTMQLLSMDRSPDGHVRFHLADPQRFLMKQAWVNGGPTAWQPGNDAPPQPSGQAFSNNGQPIGDRNPRYVQGNPIDILLVCCQNELGVGQASDTPSTWRLYRPGNDATLINPNRYLDVPGALALRDGQFSGVRFDFRLTAAQDGKQWIEEQILKPLGLYWVVRADGKLSLKSMKQPQSVNPLSLTDDNIIGTPDVERWPIVNVVQVTPGTDDASQAAPMEFVDETSDAVFNQQYEQDVQADGLRYGWGAFLIGELLADKIFRRHASNTPVYSLEAFLSAVKVEVGDFVRLTHRLLLDLVSGTVGVYGVVCEVVDRNPDYSSGRVRLKLADTRFMKFTRAVNIAPAGTPAWSSASGSQRLQYLYIANSSGANPDGSAANTIF